MFEALTVDLTITSGELAEIGRVELLIRVAWFRLGRGPETRERGAFTVVERRDAGLEAREGDVPPAAATALGARLAAAGLPAREPRLDIPANHTTDGTTALAVHVTRDAPSGTVTRTWHVSRDWGARAPGGPDIEAARALIGFLADLCGADASIARRMLG